MEIVITQMDIKEQQERGLTPPQKKARGDRECEFVIEVTAGKLAA